MPQESERDFLTEVSGYFTTSKVVESRIPSGEPFAEEGSKITCEAGHHFATLARPLWKGQRVTQADFKEPPPFQKRLSNGFPIGPCLCGRRVARAWFDGEYSYGDIHFEGRGWLPRKDQDVSR